MKTDRVEEDLDTEHLSNDDSALGKRIRDSRKKMGMNQVYVAEGLGLERSAVGNWEQGRSNPNLETVRELAEMFDVDLMWLAYGMTSSNSRYVAEIDVMEVTEDNALDKVQTSIVDKSLLKQLTGDDCSRKSLICLASKTEDDLGSPGQMVIVDKEAGEPDSSVKTFAIIRSGTWFSLRITEDVLDTDYIRIFSEKLKIDERVPKDTVDILGKCVAKISGI